MSLSKSVPHSTLRDTFAAKGWTLRTAAARLGVNHAHLYRVLQGERHSASLVARVQKLPARKTQTPA